MDSGEGVSAIRTVAPISPYFAATIRTVTCYQGRSPSTTHHAHQPYDPQYSQYYQAHRNQPHEDHADPAKWTKPPSTHHSWPHHARPHPSPTAIPPTTQQANAY